MPLVDSIRGATQAYKDDPLKLALMMAGAGMGGYSGSDKTAVRLDLQKELANGSGGITLNPFKALGLCAGLTNARYTTTTEVYPDSPRATPEQCVDAQVAAVVAAIDVAVAALG
jgi:hypothetical protein